MGNCSLRLGCFTLLNMGDGVVRNLIEIQTGTIVRTVKTRKVGRIFIFFFQFNFRKSNETVIRTVYSTATMFY